MTVAYQRVLYTFPQKLHVKFMEDKATDKNYTQGKKLCSSQEERVPQDT